MHLLTHMRTVEFAAQAFGQMAVSVANLYVYDICAHACMHVRVCVCMYYSIVCLGYLCKHYNVFALFQLKLVDVACSCCCRYCNGCCCCLVVIAIMVWG